MRIGRLAYDAMAQAHGGQVASAFTRAANIFLDGGSLVALLPPATPIHPWAIAPIDISSLVSGMEVQIAAGAIRIGPLVVSISQAEILELILSSRPRACPPEAVLAELQRLVQSQPIDDSSAEAPARERIKGALHAFSSRGDVTPLVGLIGLGPGLTPSCDDVLLGLLAALDCAGGFEPRAEDLRQKLIRELPRDLEQKTPLISAQMLRAAATGRYPEPLLELTETLGKTSASFNDVLLAVSSVQNMGHWSGHGILRGFVSGMLSCMDTDPAETPDRCG